MYYLRQYCYPVGSVGVGVGVTVGGSGSEVGQWGVGSAEWGVWVQLHYGGVLPLIGPVSPPPQCSK